LNSTYAKFTTLVADLKWNNEAKVSALKAKASYEIKDRLGQTFTPGLYVGLGEETAILLQSQYYVSLCSSTR
jgi:hypothetical protein